MRNTPNFAKFRDIKKELKNKAGPSLDNSCGEATQKSGTSRMFYFEYPLAYFVEALTLETKFER